jgi:hypothetical protein
VPIGKTFSAYLLRRNNSGDGMLESIEPKFEHEYDRYSGGWRAILSAWALVLLLAITFAGTQAFASRRDAAPDHAKRAGAVIPRHDPARAGVGVPCAAPLDACGKFATASLPDMPNLYPLW